MELIAVFDEQVCRRVLLPRPLCTRKKAERDAKKAAAAAAAAWKALGDETHCAAQPGSSDSRQRTADSKRRRPAACPNGSCLQVYAVTKTRAVQLSGSAFQISHARCGMLVCWAPKFPEGLLEGQLALLGRNGSRI